VDVANRQSLTSFPRCEKAPSPPRLNVEIAAIASRIAFVRGQRVLLDADLAALYEVPVKRLNEQVRRNENKFPADFMLFQLSAAEWEALRSQNATLKPSRGQHRKYLPYAFTEHGALMAANVLTSARANDVAIFVVRAFVQLRDLLSSHKALAQQLKEPEARIERKLDTHDAAIAGILDAIRQLMTPPEPKKRPIGFVELQEQKK
jgi:phage regulator Rha-like protein